MCARERQLRRGMKVRARKRKGRERGDTSLQCDQFDIFDRPGGRRAEREGGGGGAGRLGEGERANQERKT